MEETIETIMQWHKETFPDTTLEEQLNKFLLEYAEWAKSDETDEIADMFIAGCGIARFSLLEFSKVFSIIINTLFHCRLKEEDLVEPINSKMAINRKRTWHKVNGEYRHVDETKILVCSLAEDEVEEVLADLRNGRIRCAEKNQ